MKANHPNSNNLLCRLFSYTPRTEQRTPLEDFCTEALAWCLIESREFREDFLKLMDICIQPTQLLDIHTQYSFAGEEDDEDAEEVNTGRGRFDLVIHSAIDNAFVIVIEVKVGWDPKASQIRKYREELTRNP